MDILLAEDDENSRLMLAGFLEALGHSPRCAANGMELVRLALEKRPDLLITDLHMPGMGGDSTLAMMDMYPDLSGIPVIVATGASRREIEDMGLPRDIVVLAKPFGMAALAGAIEEAVPVPRLPPA